MAIKDKWRIRIYKDYSEAARAFRSYFLKYPYNEEALDVALKKDYCSKFKNEVENNLINLNTNQEAYLNKVYYQTICPLILHFKAAGQFYQGDRNEPLFVKFNNCYLHGLGLLAEGIRVLALQKGYNLKLVREVKPSDYELGTTNYIPLLKGVNSPEDCKGLKDSLNKLNPQGNQALQSGEKFDSDCLFTTDFLTEEGIEILPILKKEYRNSRPARITPMLYALDGLTLLKRRLDSFDIIDIHRGLTSSFQINFTEEGLRQSIHKHSEGLPKHENAVSNAKIKIKALFEDFKNKTKK